MAHNVPVVCDGFVARISKPLGLQGYKTVGGAWRGSERSDRPSHAEPWAAEGGEHIQSCYVLVCVYTNIFYYKIYTIFNLWLYCRFIFQTLPDKYAILPFLSAVCKLDVPCSVPQSVGSVLHSSCEEPKIANGYLSW